MKTSLSIFVALVAVTFAPISSAPAQVARYRVVDPTAEIPGVNQSWGMDLNDQGLAVGTFVADDWKRQYVFAWQNGQLVEVLQPQPQNPSTQPPGLLEVHRYLRATGVNDDGVIVGDAYHYSFGVFHLGFFAPVPAASWPPPLYLGTTNDFRGWWTQAVSDTDPMLVVGMGQVSVPFDVEFHGFAAPVSKSSGPLHPPGASRIPSFGTVRHRTLAKAVNRDWLVVGWSENLESYRRAFVWDYHSGQMKELGTLGGSSSEAFDISDARRIVGQADRSDGTHRAVVFESGGPRDLGTLGGAASSAHGVNERGQVVGWSWTQEGRVHAFLWQEGRLIDLNDSIAPDSGWVLQYAEAINDRGQITGWGRKDGETRAFVLDEIRR